MRRLAGTIAIAFLALSCARPVAPTLPATLRARSEGFGPVSVAPLHVHHHHDHERDTDSDHVAVACPIAMDDPGLVLARVQSTSITACDIAIARDQRMRAGMRSDDLHAILDDLVSEALLATEADVAPRLEPAVQRVLADAVVRDETRIAMIDRRPTDRELDRWLDEHPESRVRDARVHLRQLVFATQPEALAAIRALREGTPFEELLARSIDPLAQRDSGDLGLLTAEGASGVLQRVVEVGFALTVPGSVADEPVAGNASVRLPPPPGHHHRHAQQATLWHVVQLLERIPEERVADEDVRRRAAERILRDRYANARAAVREQLAQQYSAQVRGAIDHAAALRVRVRPAGGVAPPRR